MDDTIQLTPEASSKLEQAIVALGKLGLTIGEAADLQRASQLVEEAEYLEISSVEALVETLADVDADDHREDAIDAMTRAAKWLQEVSE